MRTFTGIRGGAVGSRRLSASAVASMAVLLTAEHCQQDAEIEWTRQWGGAGPTADFARKIAVDGDGNAYVAGVIGSLPGQPTAGEQDGFLRKNDPDGFELWTLVIGTAAADDAFGVVVADSGLVDATGGTIWDVYIAGTTNGVFPGETPAGLQDFWAAKVREDAGGQPVVQWLTQFGATTADNFQSAAIAVDDSSANPADRGLYVGGVSSAGTGNPTICAPAGVLGLCATGSGDAVVFRLGLDGTVDPSFPISFGSTNSDFVNAIVVYPSDDAAVAPELYLAGQAGGLLRGVRRGTVVEPIAATGVSGSDSFLIGFDSDGNVLETALGASRVIQFGSSAVDQVNGMVANGSGELLLTGRRDLHGFVAAFADDFGPGDAPLWEDRFAVPPAAGGTTPAGLTVGLALALGGPDRLFVVGGAANGVIPGALLVPGETLGQNNAFARVYEGDAAILTREFGSPSGEQASGVAATSSRVHLSGNSQAAMTGGPGTFGSQDGWTRTWDHDLASIAASAYEVTDQFGGEGPVLDSVLGVAADLQGNVVSVGFTAGAVAGFTGAGLNDAFIEKRDAGGNVLWTRQIGTSLADEAGDVAVDPRGDIYVAAFTAGTFPNLLPGSAPGGVQDALVLKYDANGNLLWTRQWGTTGPDFANGIAVDAAGRVYVTGQRNNDAFLARLTSNGSLVWETLLATTAPDAGIAVAIDGSKVVVAGGVGAIVPGALTNPAETLGNADGFVAWFNSSGERTLLVTFGTPGVDNVAGVASDPHGVYVTGVVPELLPGQEGSIYLRAYDRDGTERWTRTFASIGAGNTADGLVASPEGIYLTGSILGPLPGQVSLGFTDVYARKYQADGTEVWTEQFGTPGGDGARDVALSGTDVLLSGTTPQALPGQTNFGAGDGWVAKLNQLIVDEDP